MSDETQGQDAPQEQQQLFNEATEAPTLEKFENPELPPIQQQQQQPPKPETPDAAVPSGRFREESEARRRAERELTELRARLAAYEVQPRGQQQPQRPIDMFDNPQGFVQQQIGPYLEAFRAEFQNRTEQMSADMAVRSFGEDKVTAARQALEAGMARQDPAAWSTWQRAMGSHDPYGVITRWHMDRETIAQVGGDLDGFKQRVLEEALKDPKFQQRVFAAARGQALSAGSQVMQPITQSVPYPPSLSETGAIGPDEAITDASDISLFRTAVSAKRR